MHLKRNTVVRKKSLLFILILSISYFIPCFCSANPSLDKIKTDFRNNDWEVRLAVMERLANSKDDETVDFLMAVAGNKNEQWEVQVRAIQFLGEIQNPKAAPLLLEIFESRSKQYSCPAIKLYTALALAGFTGNSYVIPALIAGTQSDEPLVREASVQALGRIRDRRAVPHITSLLNNSSVALRLSAINSLEKIGDPKAVPDLQIVAKNDTDAVVRETARLAIDKLQIQ